MRPRAVALRAIGLGDFLVGVPALRTLRRALPDHELVLAAPRVLQPLVDLAGAVDRLLPTAELAPVPWTGPAPDVAVDLHGNGPASMRLLEALRPGRLVAFADPAGPQWCADEHERTRWCRLVSESFGVPADPGDLLLARPAAPPVVEDAVVVHAGAASASRRWPVERFGEVARWAAGRGERVALTGSAAEADAAHAVAETAGLSAASVLAGRTDLAELAAVVAAARLVVAGDTGVAHLTSAYRTPSVLLFGPVPPSQWGPPAEGPHTVLWHSTGRGDPHGDKVDPALLRIEVAEVVDAMELRLAVQRGSPARQRSTAPSG
ncbi:MAG: glycosyltransferase family 9 protein [Nocardioides sp.]|nr:glycosyltransferase family 9 protein [Nocardioides sp.]